MRIQKMKTQWIRREKGVTLIELLVALVICGVVIGAIYRLFIVQTRAYTVQDQVVEVQQNVRSTMEILLRDLRMTGYDDDKLASTVFISTPITIVQDSAITVNYEYYDSAAAQYQMHTVAFSRNAVDSTLVRQITRDPPNITTTETLLTNVDVLTFAYGIDQNEDGSVDNWVDAAGVGASRIIAVRVTLTARPSQVNPDVQTSVSPRTLTSAVTLRNRMIK